ncbi:HlyD family secretion protein [Novipirellula aureliae]|uniref:HlyD family secretion protein n=1 Tax=Novipirellula aureliae TaxID=2527966 RepID=A0A5C6E753_9BACT|nr:efflux RND transporter periplasmic adaptor subunit [Novipirellula aureliae]TWU43039.1 HlyD family secretion protein [Novipirellula aureliae]
MSPVDPLLTFATQSTLSVSIGSDAQTPLEMPVASIEQQPEAQREPIEHAIENDDSQRTDSSLRTDSSPPAQLGQLFEILGAMASSETRSDAIRSLTTELARQFPGTTVRCGIGGDRLRRLYDHRLGWLGPGSSPHQMAAKYWNDAELDRTGVTETNESLVICLPRIDRSMTCVVWIHPLRKSQVFTEWLRAIDQTLATVFWSRPQHTLPKAIRNLTRRSLLFIAVTIFFLGLVSLWPVRYRIACTARVKPMSQRMVAAPFEAVLLSSRIKPGTSVRAGDVLASLDGRPLRMEREAIAAEIQQAAKEHDTALATGKVAEAQQAKLRQRQLMRSFELLSDRLNRLQIVSPIDGIVISGELSQFVGAPLELGQSLFEIAPLESMTIEVEIPAYEIGYVKANADTRIRFPAVGGRSIEAPLSELYPAAEIRDDQNIFIGKVEVENRDGKLRPGLKGNATTYGPIRPWVWSWIRSKFERIVWWSGY